MEPVRMSLLTKIVVTILFVVVAINLLSVQGRLENARDDLKLLNQQVAAQQAENAVLQEDIANAEQRDTQLHVAKDRFGLVEADEVIIIDTAN